MRSSFVPLRALARGLSVLALFTVAACSEPTGPSGSVGGSEILGPAVTAGMFDIANEASACGVTVGGKVYCWGLYGAPANNQPGASFPAAQADGNVFASVSDAGQTTCALTLDGTAYCWGMNNYGQLGTGSASASATRVPQLVTGGHKFSKLEILGSSVIALTTAGKIYAWGQNVSGLLGDGTTIDRAAPVPIAAATTFLTLASAGGLTVADRKSVV